MVIGAIVAIDDKGVAIGAIITTIQDGTAGLQVLKHHGCPLRSGVVGTLNIGCSAVVTEQLHTFELVITVGTAAALALSAVVHAARLAAVAHQRGHGSSLSRVVGAGVVVNHVVPVHGSARQCTNRNAVGRGPVAGDGGKRCRILPEVHHLSHCCCDTTRQTRLVVIGRTLVPEWCVLIPNTRQQGRHNGRCPEHRRVVAQFLHFLVRMGQQVLNLLLVGAQPPTHVAGDAIHVKGAVTVAQDLLGTVITGNDDKAATVIVEHVEVVAVSLDRRLLGMREPQVGR